MDSLILTSEYQVIEKNCINILKIHLERNISSNDAVCVKLSHYDKDQNEKTVVHILHLSRFASPNSMNLNVTDMNDTFFSEKIEIKFMGDVSSPTRLFYYGS